MLMNIIEKANYLQYVNQVIELKGIWKSSSLAMKIEFKEYIADEAAKDIKTVQKEKMEVEKELEGLKSFKKVMDLLSTISNKSSWAVEIRRS